MTFTDARGRALSLEAPPRRIVSLVPSVTETLFALGAGHLVVGRTRFCVRPADRVADVPVVGGTKTPDVERIRALAPDLVLANAEENRAQDLAALETFTQVFVTFPRTVAQAVDDLLTLGAITAQAERAVAIAADIEEELAGLQVLAARREPFRFVYLVWRRPYITVNRDTYIHDLLSLGGGINVFADAQERYPQVSAEQILAGQPDLVFLPSEPFPFAEKHAAELFESCNDPRRWRDRILLVDGEMFNWHGARTREGLQYYQKIRSSR